MSEKIEGTKIFHDGDEREKCEACVFDMIEFTACYRCGVELVANQWVYSKASRGDTTILSERRHSACQHGYGQPKIYHLECAKEVKLVT